MGHTFHTLTDDTEVENDKLVFLTKCLSFVVKILRVIEAAHSVTG